MVKLRKLTTRLLSLTLAAVMSLFAVGGSAFAEAIIYKWGVDRSPADTNDRYGWVGNGSTKFSVDDKVHTDNSLYSIKLDNTDYNLSYVERTFNVEPYTTYRFSAMVKYSGYELSPNAKNQKSGACVGKAYTYNNSGYTTSSDWTFMEYEFSTGNETTYNLALQNGIFNGDCKGTAWFSDVKLEKAVMTNSWNILAVFFKNADATVSLNGKTVHHKMSLRKSDIDGINTHVLDTLPSAFKTMTNNKMNINCIDRYYTDEVLTEKDLTPRYYQDDAKTIPSGYMIDYKNSEVLSKVLDKYLAQKHYNQIIVFVPFEGIDGGWLGLGGTTYKGINFAQITNSWEGVFNVDRELPCEAALHEMTHCLERKSRKINGDKTPSLDDERKTYQDKYGLSAVEWYTGYLTATLPDGRGLDPSVFNVPSGKYTLVSDDMTTGVGIEPGSSSVTPPAPKNFRAESVSDENIKFSWDTVPKAEGYQFVRFEDADFKEMARDPSNLDSDGSTTWGPYTKGKTYYFGIRTAASVNGKTVYSDWTTLKYTHMGVGIVRGDVDNSGALDFDDISAAITYFLNGNKLDKRTADSMGITGRDYMDFDDVQNLITWFLESI